MGSIDITDDWQKRQEIRLFSGRSPG